MVALKLHESGFRVTVYTKGPDPRKNKDAEQFGATGNGRMGRFVTGFEGETYLSDTPMYPNMKWAFEHPVSEGGWLAKPVPEFSERDQRWLQKRSLAANNQDVVKDLFENYYVKNNSASITAWQELYKSHSFLFKDTDITDPLKGVLRLYNSSKQFDSTVASHKKYGFLIEELSPDDVARRFPVYKYACSKGLIAGGIIAKGFAFNILKFVDNVIEYLSSENVEFVWNTEVQKIVLNEKGIVRGLKINNGELICSDHYSINPGAYGNDILNNTPAKDKIGGVAGRWLIMPRPEGYDVPTKIHGDIRSGFPVTDNNLTPFIHNGKRMIAVGGGYVYVGSNEKEYNGLDVYKIVDSENERVMELYLGDFYISAKQNNEISIWTNTCIRSFTYDDRPIHEVMKTTSDGYLTITAGTNTGTTTLAPYIAKWTLEKLTEKNDNMKIADNLHTTGQNNVKVSGNMIFISGQNINSVKVDFNILDIKSETKQVMENIKNTLIASGIDFSNVVKATIFLNDLENLAVVNEVYASYFTENFPACDVINSSSLQLNANIEISLIAAK
jgi:2-iminobutanoate/2-iminopropanoate deaminase